MAQQTCCVSSRPAPRLVDRSLFRTSSNPRFAKRLGRIARRALAALLIVGGTSLGASQATVAAHDHLPAVDETVQVEAAANSLPSRLTGDAMLGRWLSSVEAAETACGPAREIFEAGVVHSAGPLAAKHQVVFGGGGASAIHPTTANQWQDYCKLRNLLAWGDQAKQWASPSIRSAEMAAAAEAAKSDDSVVAMPSRELVRGLSDLSCEEPIDVAPPAEAGFEMADDASESPKFESAAFVGSGPMVTTIAESYLPYDMSPEDAIAMRMYPIDGPTISGAPISYLGARRTSIYGPVPNFEANGNWHQQVEPGIVLSTPAADAPAIEVAASTAEPETVFAESVLPESTANAIREIAKRVVASVQPDSELRSITSATRLGKRVGEAAGSGLSAADLAVGQMTTRLASVWQLPPQPRPLLAAPAERLVAGARLETPRPVAEVAAIAEPVDDLAENVANVEATRLMQIELACKAALDVVKQQAARGAAAELPAAEIVATVESVTGPSCAALSDAPPADELVRAQAVATACDLAAASLEKLAMSLRRAGDSLVRQAKANGGANQSLLR